MPNLQELTQLYSSYSDEELLRSIGIIDDYSPAAREALNRALNERGGMKTLLARIQQANAQNQEMQRLEREAQSLLADGAAHSQLKDQMQSSLLPPEQVAEAVAKALDRQQRKRNDESIKMRTIWGSLVGGLVGGTAAGLAAGAYMAVRTNRISIFLIIGMFLIPCGIIRLLTGQSLNNRVVTVASVFACIYAFCLGFTSISWFK